MSQKPYPDWMKPAFDERFNELAVMARKQGEVQIIRQEQDGLIELLKKELTVTQYKLRGSLD